MKSGLPGEKKHLAVHTTKGTKRARNIKEGAQKKAQARQLNRARVRMRILRGAMAAFGRLGYADTRVEDILEHARVSRPTFYRYFKSKEDAFDAVDEVISMSFLQTWTSAVESVEDPADKLEKGIDAYLQWLYATGPVASATRRYPIHPDIHIATRREEGIRMIVDFFRRETFKALGEEYDPWLFFMLQAATEKAGELLIAEGLRPGDAKRAKQSMMRILAATLSEGDISLPPIPRAPRGPRKKRVTKRKKKSASTKS